MSQQMVGHWFNSLADFATQWLPLAFFGILVLTAWLLWKTVGMMPRVRPTRVDSRSKSSVTWEDVAGVEEVRAELMEVVDFLRHPEQFERLGARVPKGLLLYGPPGTGKTLMAKAVASESGANFYSSSASAFVEMFAGLGAARIRKLFQDARKNAPSIICNEAAIFAGRKDLQYIRHADFDAAMERIVAGLQQRRVVTEKEKRILAYHEAGHAVMSHLTGDFLPVQKVTIVARGQALGYTLNLPNEDRYLHTKEELIDLMKVYLGCRAAVQVVFGRVTNGAANDLEKVTERARAMGFEYGMSEDVTSRTMRADNYALSEETKRLRDSEQARLTDHAFAESVRLLSKHRPALDRVAAALLEKETLVRDEIESLLADTAVDSRSSDFVGVSQVVPLPAAD